MSIFAKKSVFIDFTFIYSARYRKTKKNTEISRKDKEGTNKINNASRKSP